MQFDLKQIRIFSTFTDIAKRVVKLSPLNCDEIKLNLRRNYKISRKLLEIFKNRIFELFKFLICVKDRYSIFFENH